MEEKFVILCCENIRPEVDAVLADGSMPGAVAESFPFHCGHVRSVWETVSEQVGELRRAETGTCILGCGCANTFDIPDEVMESPALLLIDSGAPLFLPPALVAEYRRHGAYLIVPGWLFRWKQNADRDGLDRSTARELFRDSLTEIILLDTGVHRGFEQVLAEFSDFTGLPATVLPVGTEHLRFRIAEQYRLWQCAQEMAACRVSVSTAEKRVADYSMIADLTGKIVGIHDENAVILEMLDLFILLCSPKRVGFMPVTGGTSSRVISIPSNAYPEDGRNPLFSDPGRLYRIADTNDGFLFRVEYDNDLIGILSVDEVSIPSALDEYLNLAHFIVQIAGLSITIARTHQSLVQTVTERNAEIASRNKIEIELHLHSEILQNMAEGVALIRASDGIIVFANPRFYQMFGYDTGELLGQSVSVLNAPDKGKPEEIAKEIIQELEASGVWSGEIRNVRKDQSRFWCHAIVSSYNHPTFGKVWITVHEDITEMKLVEAALAGTEQRYRQLYEGMRDAFASVDLEGRITGFNPAFARLVGYEPEEIYTLTYRDLTPERWRVSEEEIIKNQVLPRGYSDIYEKEYQQKDGTVIPVELRTNLIVGEDGTPQGMWSIVRDITQRKEDENALAESEERYRTIIENIQDVFFRIDKENRIIMASPSAVQMFGHASLADIIGKPVTTLWRRPEQRAGFLDAMIKQGGAVHDWEAEFVRSDSTAFWVSISAHLHTDKQGGYAGTEGIIRDITERRKAEEALRSAIKKLNMLSSITRHDILNQVMGLRAFLELSKEDLKGTSHEMFIIKEDQAAEAIQRQIEFTRYYQDIGVNEPKWQDAESVIHEAKDQLNPAGIEVRIPVEGIEVYADPLIVKVFFNLMENSLRHGEHVTIMDFSIRQTDAGLVITYRDNGVGVSEADKKRLFQKGFGKHTGLGLFLSREILAITGITITENGEPGTGVRFEITVPPQGFRYRP